LNGPEQSPLLCTSEMGLWTPVHGRVDLFHHFFNRKLIHKFQKIIRALDLCKNTPDIFYNYILVTIILHLGPCLTFHNYN
jgi:hypothetical protein